MEKDSRLLPLKPPVGDIGESNDWSPPNKCRFVIGVGSSTKISTPESSVRSEGSIEIKGLMGGLAVDGVGPETAFIERGVIGDVVDAVTEFAVADSGGG